MAWYEISDCFGSSVSHIPLDNSGQELIIHAARVIGGEYTHGKLVGLEDTRGYFTDMPGFNLVEKIHQFLDEGVTVGVLIYTYDSQFKQNDSRFVNLQYRMAVTPRIVVKGHQITSGQVCSQIGGWKLILSRK